MIGVLGGSETVGAVTADRLARQGLGPVRVGGRDLGRAEKTADSLDTVAEAVRVDLADARSLAEFCAGTSVVVNCAGPSYRVLDTVARAAVAAGADYVDAVGGAVAAAALEENAPDALARRSAVFSAGLMPGLSGLLPRPWPRRCRWHAWTSTWAGPPPSVRSPRSTPC